MLPVLQTILADPARADGHDANGQPGNCYQAAIASALDLHLAEVPSDDEVDAWWLRQMGLAHLGDPDAVPLPQTHLSVLDKVVWP